MSPIFIRPVREQLEHDRLIRHLQARYKKTNNEVAINPGEDQGTSVKLGPALLFPDLVVSEGGRLTGLVEVESGESVNNLEVMAQWAHFGKARVPFHLYVPVQFFESAKRLADARGVRITEIWTYRGLLDGFDLVRMHHDPAVGVPKAGVPGVRVNGRPTPKPVDPVDGSAAVASTEVPAAPPAALAKPAIGKAAPVATVATAKPASAAKPVPAATARPVKPVRPVAPVAAKVAKPGKAPPAKVAKVVVKPTKPANLAKGSKPTKPLRPAARPAAAKGKKAKGSPKTSAKRPKSTPKGAKKAGSARRK